MLNVKKLFKKRNTNLGTKLWYTRYILKKILITFKIINKFQIFALQCKNKFAAEWNLHNPVDFNNNFNKLKVPLKLGFVLINQQMFTDRVVIVI